MDQRVSQVGAAGNALSSRMVACALHNRVQFICAVKCERLRPLEAAHLRLVEKNRWIVITWTPSKPVLSPKSQSGSCRSDHLLLRRVSGPGKRRLRGGYHEQGPRAVADRIRLRRRRLLSSPISSSRSIQPDARKIRRAQMDCAHHAELGILSGAMAFIPAIASATGLGNEHSSTGSGASRRPKPASFPHHLLSDPVFPAEYRARIVGYFMAASRSPP